MVDPASEELRHRAEHPVPWTPEQLRDPRLAAELIEQVVSLQTTSRAVAAPYLAPLDPLTEFLTTRTRWCRLTEDRHSRGLS